MPIFVYECKNVNCEKVHTSLERNVPSDLRDDQDCEHCTYPLNRLVRFTGLTWAPTAGGMR